jgi:hypothetical protein
LFSCMLNLKWRKNAPLIMYMTWRVGPPSRYLPRGPSKTPICCSQTAVIIQIGLGRSPVDEVELSGSHTSTPPHVLLPRLPPPSPFTSFPGCPAPPHTASSPSAPESGSRWPCCRNDNQASATARLPREGRRLVTGVPPTWHRPRGLPSDYTIYTLESSPDNDNSIQK